MIESNVAEEWLDEVRSRLAKLGKSQEWLSLRLGIDPAPFSRYLRGIRPAPEGFQIRVDAELTVEERARRAGEQAAEKERRKAAKELGGAA